MSNKPTYDPLELLQRWLQGDARKEEEQQLQELAQEDPFLRDAMEGYRSLPAGEHAERVNRIKERVRERSRRRRSGLFYLPRIAAAALVLALLGAGFWYLNQNTSNGTVAMEEQAEEAVEDKRSPTAAIAPEEESAGFSGERDLASTAPPSSAPKPSGKRSIENAAASPNSPETVTARDKQEVEVAAVPELADEALAPDVKEAPPEIEAEEAPAAQYYTTLPRPLPALKPLKGIVMTSDGVPLADAKVSVPGMQKATITGRNGQFTLPLDSTPSEVIVQYEGYDTFRAPVEQSDSLSIVFPAAAPLALGEQKAKSNLSRSLKEESAGAKPFQPVPQPEGGFSKLEKYIRKNLQYPEAARREEVEGEIMLSFYIQPDGALTDFQAEKSLGYGCDKEAIRLLKEGPKWKGAGQRATYTITFKLE